jgi:CRP-like cAMP-binding protein
VVSEESYDDGAVLIHENDNGDWMYVILEGRAKVKKRAEKGNVTIDTLKEGNIFGEMVLLQQGDNKRFATVVADGPVVIGGLDTQRLIHDWNSLTPFLKKLIGNLIQRRQEAASKLISMILASSR